MRYAFFLAVILAACTTYRINGNADGEFDSAVSSDGYVVVDANGKGAINVMRKESSGWVVATRSDGSEMAYTFNGKFRKAWKRRGGFSIKFDEVPVEEALAAMGLPADWPEGSASIHADAATRIAVLPR